MSCVWITLLKNIIPQLFRQMTDEAHMLFSKISLGNYVSTRRDDTGSLSAAGNKWSPLSSQFSSDAKPFLLPHDKANHSFFSWRAHLCCTHSIMSQHTHQFSYYKDFLLTLSLLFWSNNIFYSLTQPLNPTLKLGMCIKPFQLQRQQSLPTVQQMSGFILHCQAIFAPKCRSNKQTHSPICTLRHICNNNDMNLFNSKVCLK